MSYRYTTVDIIVGVGMCAIVFGALLLFVAASGTFLVPSLQTAAIEQSSGPAAGMSLLQPALGQAIVERTLLQRYSDRVTAEAILEWNQAMQAHHSLQSIPGGPFGFVVQRAATVPDEHAARVQTVMGRSIVNFTRRGIRSGVLSADQYLSDYNRNMIGMTETTGQKLDREFASTWQAILGRWIVDASRDYVRRGMAVQERLGTAILHMTQAKTGLEDAWATNQYQLASLIAAVDRTAGTPDRTVQVASADFAAERASVGAARPVSLPEIPMGYLIVAAMALGAVFFGGLILSAANREAKALADMKRDSSRWVYRMAA
jgi:hypothetical protein